jgi:AraC-like DNA-binding protein
MDARAQQAREYHQMAEVANSAANHHRQQRDQLVRALRAEDPAEWSYRKLAAAIGCSMRLIRQILEDETEEAVS